MSEISSAFSSAMSDATICWSSSFAIPVCDCFCISNRSWACFHSSSFFRLLMRSKIASFDSPTTVYSPHSFWYSVPSSSFFNSSCVICVSSASSSNVKICFLPLLIAFAISAWSCSYASFVSSFFKIEQIFSHGLIVCFQVSASIVPAALTVIWPIYSFRMFFPVSFSLLHLLSGCVFISGNVWSSIG